MKRFGVLIPHRSNVEGLNRAVEHLDNQSVFVVLDGTEKPQGLDDHIECLYSPSLGFSGAVNIGLSAMQRLGFTHVLLLNDDAVISPSSIDVMKKAFVEGVGAVGPRLVEGEQISYGFTLSKWTGIRPLLEPQHPQALSGACLLVPSWVRFNPIFPHGIEDIDLCLRLNALNLKIVCVPEAVCQHDGGSTLSIDDSFRQRASVFGQLHVLNGRWPVVIFLNCMQILRERGPRERFKAVFQGVSDYRSSTKPFPA